MKTLKNKPTEISAGAMADIAFLLLVFFFVCTTIIEEEGILVQLPPYEMSDPPPIPKKNVFNLLVNANDQLMAEGEEMSITQINGALKKFVLNPNKSENLPNKPTKAVISLQCDRGTSYEKYIEVYNELKKGYFEMWNNYAMKSYGQNYDLLPKKTQKEIRNEIPLLISEAESKDFASLE